MSSAPSASAANREWLSISWLASARRGRMLLTEPEAIPGSLPRKGLYLEAQGRVAQPGQSGAIAPFPEKSWRLWFSPEVALGNLGDRSCKKVYSRVMGARTLQPRKGFPQGQPYRVDPVIGKPIVGGPGAAGAGTAGASAVVARPPSRLGSGSAFCSPLPEVKGRR